MTLAIHKALNNNEENEERLFKFSPLSSKKVDEDQNSNGLNHS